MSPRTEESGLGYCAAAAEEIGLALPRNSHYRTIEDACCVSGVSTLLADPWLTATIRESADTAAITGLL